MKLLTLKFGAGLLLLALIVYTSCYKSDVLLEQPINGQFPDELKVTGINLIDTGVYVVQSDYTLSQIYTNTHIRDEISSLVGSYDSQKIEENFGLFPHKIILLDTNELNLKIYQYDTNTVLLDTIMNYNIVDNYFYIDGDTSPIFGLSPDSVFLRKIEFSKFSLYNNEYENSFIFSEIELPMIYQDSLYLSSKYLNPAYKVDSNYLNENDTLISLLSNIRYE